MKKLLKTYGFQYQEIYFDMCIESYINGQKTQAKEQYMAMPREKRKLMISYLLYDYSYVAFDLENNKELYHFFFNLL
jgi:hypothetical protein